MKENKKLVGKILKSVAKVSSESASIFCFYEPKMPMQLLKEKQTAIYSVEIWKRFRKWGGIPTGLTQNVGDFLKSEEIEGILGNSDFVYLLNQNAKDQHILADKLGLSEKQLMHVTNSEPGSGLILFDNVVIPFVDKYPANTKTFAIMNTKPEESVTKEDEEG